MPPQKPESPLSSPARRPTGLGIPSTIQIVIAGKSDGFERRPPDPPWVMLPERGERSLFLFLALQSNEPIRIANANAQGLIVDSLGRALCQASGLGRALNLRGLQPGRVVLQIQQGNGRLELHATVKRRLKVPLLVHYVEHEPQSRTRTTPQALREIIKTANTVLEPQANVVASVATEGTLTHERINALLGPTVTSATDKGGGEWDLVTAHAISLGSAPDARHQLNLFLVRDFEVAGGNDTAAGTRNGCCLLEDHVDAGGRIDTARAGRVLAHEIGHHLGLFHVDSREALMHEASLGDRLSRTEIEQMNPSGTTINPL